IPYTIYHLSIPGSGECLFPGGVVRSLRLRTAVHGPRPTVLCVRVLVADSIYQGKTTGKKKPRRLWRGAVWVRAATYSPGCNPSTIGAAGLNFSVRDGKRWDPCAGPPKIFARHKA